MSERPYVKSQRVDLLLALTERMVDLALAGDESTRKAIIPTVRHTLRWVHEQWAPCRKRRCKICRSIRRAA